MRVDKPKPRPVDDRRHDRGQKPPAPGGGRRLVLPFATMAQAARRPRWTATMAPEIQPLYLNNCDIPTARPSKTARSRLGRSRNRWPMPMAHEPEKEKRRIGQGHSRKRDMRARKCGESRGRAPCSGPERSPRQPGRHRDRQGAGRNRHENRRDVADAKDQVRQSNKNGNPGGAYEMDVGIDAGQSAAATGSKVLQARRSLHQSEPARAGPATRDGRRHRRRSGR